MKLTNKLTAAYSLAIMLFFAFSNSSMGADEGQCTKSDENYSKYPIQEYDRGCQVTTTYYSCTTGEKSSETCGVDENYAADKLVASNYGGTCVWTGKLADDCGIFFHAAWTLYQRRCYREATGFSCTASVSVGGGGAGIEAGETFELYACNRKTHTPPVYAEKLVKIAL